MLAKLTVSCLLVVTTTLSCGKSENDENETSVGGTTAGSSNDAGSSGSGGSDSGGASSSGSSGSGGASSGGSGTGEAGSPSEVDTDPLLCGGAYPSECAEGKMCLFDSGCGTVGYCVRKPDGCDENYEPVCGCDGATYGNACAARMAGVSPSVEGECDALFDCGPYRCDIGSYCLDKADDADGPWRYACIALPSTCNGAASCDCVANVRGCFTGFTCAPSGGSVTLTCE